MIVTNYEGAIFMRRMGNVQDKAILASPTIWWNQQSPPARVCWLYMLQLAADLLPLKLSLKRELVPPTFEGYPVRPQQAERSGQEHRLRSPAPKYAMLQAKVSSAKGFQLLSPSSCISTAAAQRPGSSSPALPDSHAASADDSIAADSSAAAAQPFPSISFASLGLTCKILGGGKSGHVAKVGMLSSEIIVTAECIPLPSHMCFAI